MNIQEANLILQAYRPGGQDAADPMFAEASRRQGNNSRAGGGGEII